jgi:hypothetical protein
MIQFILLHRQYGNTNNKIYSTPYLTNKIEYFYICAFLIARKHNNKMKSFLNNIYLFYKRDLWQEYNESIV